MPVYYVEDISPTVVSHACYDPRRYSVGSQVANMAAFGVIDGIIYVIYLGITIKMCTFAAETTNNKEK